MKIYAEVKIDGLWCKVGQEFTSTYTELKDQLVDRVFDGYDRELYLFLTLHSPTGLPSDLSTHLSTVAVDSPSCHWTTLGDLLNWTVWDEPVYKTGYITEWQYKRLKDKNIKPTYVVPKAMGPVTTPFMFNMLEQHPSLRTTSKYYLKYKYDPQTPYEKFSHFCSISIPELISLIPEGGNAEDVRIIILK